MANFDANEFLSDNEKQALLWLWENREEIERRYQEDDIMFDYPQYGGMPEPYYATLSGELVDWVQERVQSGFPSNKPNFLRKAMKYQL